MREIRTYGSGGKEVGNRLLTLIALRRRGFNRRATSQARFQPPGTGFGITTARLCVHRPPLVQLHPGEIPVESIQHRAISDIEVRRLKSRLQRARNRPPPIDRNQYHT